MNNSQDRWDILFHVYLFAKYCFIYREFYFLFAHHRNGFVLDYNNKICAPFLTWNCLNFRKIFDNLHPCILYCIFRRALIFTENLSSD